MADVILTAGLPAADKATSPKRELIKQVRQVLRNPQASDDEVDDALEALTELSKE